MENKINIVVYINELKKIHHAIREEKSKGVKDSNIKEIDVLKERCISDNIQSSLLSCQIFVRLIEDGILEASQVLAIFFSMLPYVKSNQYTGITEGIISILISDLRQRTILETTGDKYISPFEIRAPQHPIIMLLQKKYINMNDLVNKISGFCSHHDKNINKNSLEFLRPVFLYVLCNPNTIPDSKSLWTCLLTQSKKFPNAISLIDEIACWCKISSSTSILFTSILLTEAIEFMMTTENYQLAIEYTIYLTSLINDLIFWGYDPRPQFNLILRIFMELKEKHLLIGSIKECLNLILLLLSKPLQNMSPIYIDDFLPLLKWLITCTEEYNNQIIWFIILDSLIKLMANSYFLSNSAIDDLCKLIDLIEVHKSETPINTNKMITLISKIKYYHQDIAFYFDLLQLIEQFNKINEIKLLEEYFINLLDSSKNIKVNNAIINLLLRGLFHYTNNKLLPFNSWQIIFKIILINIGLNEIDASNVIYCVLYRLTKVQQDAVYQLELLKGLTKFSVVKENIPIILSTIKALSTSNSLKSLAYDLYLKLWQIEDRTYPFLNSLLSNEKEDKNAWELNIAQAYTIKEICKLKPSQHGKEFVTKLSNILNTCTDDQGDLATSLALDAIIILCNSNTINVASTWKALSVKFKNEKRLRSAISLCKFFGNVPLLRSPSVDYEKLFTEAYDKLWHYAQTSDKREIIEVALNELKNFPLEELTLKQIPNKFRQNISIPSEYVKTPIDAARDPIEVLSYIPGECWLQVLQKINKYGMEKASDLISHFIHSEIDEYRSGVYNLPAGRPEPQNFNGLQRKSPLRAIINYIILQSKSARCDNELILLNCLRCISKKFPKPMPPLNWFFLIEFLNRSIYSMEFTKCVLKIASNQLKQSGSAKNLLENYLLKFNFNDNIEDEVIIVLIELLSHICLGGLSIGVFQNFTENLIKYTYKQSQLGGFETGCIFEKALLHLKIVLIKSDIPDEIMEILTNVFEKYMMTLPINSAIFQIFTDVICSLPMNTLDGLTSPNTWWEILPDKFKKAMLIRCQLIQRTSSALDNHLFLLSPIIDNVHKSNVETTFILRNLIGVLHKFENDKNALNWTLDMLSKIQLILSPDPASTSSVSNDLHIFYIDVFILSCIILSGCGLFFMNANQLVESRQNRFDVFPEAVFKLCEREYWNDHFMRIYEFIYHLYTNETLPSFITKTMRDALICAKNHNYFLQKGIWTKYIGLRN